MAAALGRNNGITFSTFRQNRQANFILAHWMFDDNVQLAAVRTKIETPNLGRTLVSGTRTRICKIQNKPERPICCVRVG